MSEFLVFTKEKTIDEQELKLYADKIMATFEGHQVEILAAYGRHEVLEGESAEDVGILEFSSFEAAKIWYDSPAYQGVREHRFKGAIYRGLLAEDV
jgi:uncharacterized protein (DUF1330 family)